MQTVMSGYRGFSFVLGLNWDLLFCVGTIAFGLMAGAFLGQIALNP
ncbi:hypothetical protein [Pseudorhodobacter turbinis]|nr:hypothetical protein [Pseudorhodobacter turbinis]